MIKQRVISPSLTFPVLFSVRLSSLALAESAGNMGEKLMESLGGKRLEPGFLCFQERGPFLEDLSALIHILSTLSMHRRDRGLTAMQDWEPWFPVRLCI